MHFLISLILLGAVIVFVRGVEIIEAIDSGTFGHAVGLFIGSLIFFVVFQAALFFIVGLFCESERTFTTARTNYVAAAASSLGLLAADLSDPLGKWSSETGIREDGTRYYVSAVAAPFIPSVQPASTLSVVCDNDTVGGNVRLRVFVSAHEPESAELNVAHGIDDGALQWNAWTPATGYVFIEGVNAQAIIAQFLTASRTIQIRVSDGPKISYEVGNLRDTVGSVLESCGELS